VALKTLTNSQNLNQEFLKELTLYKMFKSEVSNMVPCYGISKDPEGNYIMVMKYMEKGNLRDYLRKRDYFSLEDKFRLLKHIIQGLKDIHRKKLVHRDFHSGNIIVDVINEGGHDEENVCRITDLGLSKLADEKDNSQVYGVMPYMAPEVLRGEPYTQKSDVYSLGMIMYEIVTDLPPF
ncbi:kinase-like domain-containing protein, partial [Glomus cerebriforme]